MSTEENCDHNCDSCGEEGCKSRKIEKLKPHPETKIGKTIAIISGKGGVGKTMVTSLLGAELLKKDKKVAIMDADVTGPSIPQAFGVTGQAIGDENGIFAMKTKHDLRLMSVNCLLDNASDPVLWRGPLIANLVGQLYTNVIYGEVQYLLIDMPPGTGDVPLTVFQQIPVDGAIVVASPQELVSMIVEKAVNMCKMMKIPLLGLVENMAYVSCPHCGEKIEIYGPDKGKEIAKRYGIPLLDELPIDPTLAKATDEGAIEEVAKGYLPKTVAAIEKL
jgi:Mrp family chromosome partitioning ATPase